MRRLPKDFSRCINDKCIDRFNCLRFNDKPSGSRLSIAEFPKPEKSGECPFFILTATKEK